MSNGGRKPAPLSPPSADVSPLEPTADGLFTAEDLFGDLVDAPPPSRSDPPQRPAPIRVQVNEPAAPPKAARSLSEVPPEEMAALINAIGDASVPAPAPVVEPEPSGEPEITITVDEDEAVPSPSETPTHPFDLDALLPSAAGVSEDPAPANGNATVADLSLSGLDDEPPAPLAEFTPPETTPAPRSPLDSLFEPLESRTETPTTRFSATPAPTTGLPLEERVSLDLAALAEDALRTAPVAEAPARSAARGGQSYGPYTLLQKVAVGGMAEVFKAKRAGVEGFEKVVAVKRILSHLSDNKEFVDMFVDEAKMVAGLTHPSIVQIFDLGKIERSYYIAMEYVHGRDLRTILKRAQDRRQRLPLDISALIASRVCAALDYAHRKKDDRGQPMRIVHRDVSPQNILISFEGEVKLTDFGIARAASKARNTERGALRGKLLYMSPEQAWGQPLDRRADIFSLGIVLYEMLTSEKPFLGTSELSILERVRECQVPPPATLNPKIPERLQAVVMKALAKEPDDRYQDASEMARDLERALPDRNVPGPHELARCLELLFEPEERNDALPEPSVAAEPEIDVPAARPAAAAAPRDLTIDHLLKRFGIK